MFLVFLFIPPATHTCTCLLCTYTIYYFPQVKCIQGKLHLCSNFSQENSNFPLLVVFTLLHFLASLQKDPSKAKNGENVSPLNGLNGFKEMQKKEQEVPLTQHQVSQLLVCG